MSGDGYRPEQIFTPPPWVNEPGCNSVCSRCKREHFDTVKGRRCAVCDVADCLRASRQRESSLSLAQLVAHGHLTPLTPLGVRLAFLQAFRGMPERMAETAAGLFFGWEGNTRELLEAAAALEGFEVDLSDYQQ